jgi:hypothetical protein
MRKFQAALVLSSVLAVAGAISLTATPAAAQDTYVACNTYGDCWRVHKEYAYGPDAPITYYHSDYYDQHLHDEHIHWRADHYDDAGYYDRNGNWHPDAAGHVVASGATGAGVGAAIGCIVTLPIGCAPGAAVGAAVGGGVGVTADAASEH